jgi:hypothetical protein
MMPDLRPGLFRMTAKMLVMLHGGFRESTQHGGQVRLAPQRLEIRIAFEAVADLEIGGLTGVELDIVVLYLDGAVKNAVQQALGGPSEKLLDVLLGFGVIELIAVVVHQFPLDMTEGANVGHETPSIYETSEVTGVFSIQV